MKASALFLILAITAPAARVAAETPPGSEPRIHDMVYAPGQVYRVSGAFRTATQILFSPEESIRQVAIGDSLAWEVAAEGSVLFLKPRERHQATNLLVVTQKDGENRHYAFELTTRPASDRTPPVYRIRFLYPDDVRAEAVALLETEQRAAEERLIGLRLRQGALEGPRNLAWSAQGAAPLQPSEVTDNGRFTLLRFPGAQALPAIFEVGEDGAERLIPYDVRGEFVVIHGAPRGLRLRRGGLVLCLFNDAWSPQGASTGTGTASPDVERRAGAAS